MNFFQHQDRARKNTGLLVFLFVLAVLCLIALTNLLVIGVVFYIQHDNLPGDSTQLVSPQLILSIALVILAVVGLASLYKWAQMSGGGKRVAEAMGGRLLNSATRDANERKVLNVVEEMAIASGTQVPAVYLIDEPGINAFAAGLTTKDAVIGITRGSIEMLSRDELQGVIAHEFSHIFNGDMRLNMRLIGILHGILVIGIIGTHLLRLVSRGGARTRSSKNQGVLPFLVAGAGLTAIGYLGTFFGNLIKAAVSRQREYLADASAVQFTRNPLGIGGALKKIGGHVPGSGLTHPATAEFSHLFFSQAVSQYFSGLLATHPPLDDRIKRIDPRWDGSYPAVKPLVQAAQNEPDDSRARVQTADVLGLAAALAVGVTDSRGAADNGDVTPSPVAEPGRKDNGSESPQPVSTQSWVDSIGMPGKDQIDYARHFLASIPAKITQAAHEPYGARALVYCLLLDRARDVRARQLQCLQHDADIEVFRLVQQLAGDHTEKVENRLPLLDLALPALKQLAPGQYRKFRSNLISLIHADQRVELFEWALFRIIINALGEKSKVFGKSGVRSLQHAAKACGLLLSAVASAAAESEQGAKECFANAKDYLGLDRIVFIARDDYDLKDLSKAVAVLERLAPLQKPRLLKALCMAALFDGRIDTVEVELIRALADSLNCPMPPLDAKQISI